MTAPPRPQPRRGAPHDPNQRRSARRDRHRGRDHAPAFKRGPFIPDNDGLSVVLPGMYGYVYNVRTGDPAFGWQGDHVEPGASIDSGDAGIHHALHYLVCIGNEAVVTSGEATGAVGVVTGEHARNLSTSIPTSPRCCASATPSRSAPRGAG
jgi:hypothetical protein